MLRVSESAAAILDDARTAQQLPDGVGVRVFPQPAPDGAISVSLAFSEEPADGDQVIEQPGPDLYVAPELVETLADSTIDVEQTPQGAQLVIKPQERQA